MARRAARALAERGVAWPDERARGPRRPADRTDSRHGVPGAAADCAGPATPPGGGDHHAPGARPDGVRVRALDRPDPRLAADLRGARSRDRASAPARAHVARERAPHRERRRVRPARPGDRARRLVEHARLVDLRGDRGRGAALEVPDPLPRRPRLQPLELRARPLLPAPRPGARGPARALVGADVGVDGARARRHPRRRPRHPLAPAAARARRLLLGRVCRRDRRARGERARDDRALAPGARDRLGVLARARLLARDPRLSLLHDHRPEDDPARAARAAALRSGDRARRRAPDRAADDRVRHQGRRARGARARLRGPARRRGRSRRGSAAPGRPGACAPERSRWPERRRSRRWSSSPGSPPAPTRPPRAVRPSGPGSCRRSRSSSRRASPPSSTGRRRSGSPATSSPVSAPRPRRWPSATRRWPPRRRRAHGSLRCGSRWTRPGARSPSPTTTSSAWS